MTTPDNKTMTPDTDAAWNSLHDRLSQDHLLGNVTPSKFTVWWEASWQWVSIAVMALGVISILLLYIDIQTIRANTLTVVNLENEGVLVKTLADGSTIYLATNAILSYPLHFSALERKVNLIGDAMFDIARNPQKPFIIETRNIQVEVLGTAFSIETTTDGRFQLSVARGKVKVSDKSNDDVVYVKAGERVILQNAHLYKSANPDSLLFSRYTSNMRFKDEPLESIIRVINQYAAQPVALEGEAIKHEKLNVRFYNNNVQSMTQIISIALHLKREVTQDTIFLYR